MNHIYSKIQRSLYDYLQQHSLARVACLSNGLPSRFEKQFLLKSFNYICFSAEGLLRKSEVLFLLGLYGYRNTSIDVLNASLKSCLTKRQFGFLNIQCRNNDEAQSIISEIIKHKEIINLRYPILARIKSSMPLDLSLSDPAALESAMASEDWIIKIS